MKRIILGLVFCAAAVATATASPHVGDLVSYRVATSQYNLAVIGRVVSGNTVDIVAFSDGTTWQDGGTPAGVSTITYTSIALGTGVGQYQPTTIIADTVAAAGYATSSDVSSAISSATSGLASEAYAESYADGLAENYMAPPAAPSSASLTLGGSGVQFSTTRPTFVNVRLTASTLLVAQTYTVELRCDSGGTPSAIVDDASGTVLVGELQPAKLHAFVPAGHYCRVFQSAGAATLALTGSSKQLM